MFGVDVIGTGVLQRSFVVTQILKVPFVVGTVLVEYTLTKYVFPTVSPDAVRTSVLLQVIFESAAHEPENSCNPRLIKFAPALLNVIVWTVELAINLYHTSYTGVPQIGNEGPADKVAPTTLPGVFVHVVPGVNTTAPAQLSLAGGGSVMQIVKVPFVVGTAFGEYNLTKYVLPIVNPAALMLPEPGLGITPLHEIDARPAQVPEKS